MSKDITKSFISHKLSLYEKKLESGLDIEKSIVDSSTNEEPTKVPDIETDQDDVVESELTILKKENQSRVQDKNDRTIFISFPEVVGCINDVKELVPEATIIKSLGESKNENYIKSIYVEFLTADEANKRYEKLKSIKLSSGKLKINNKLEKPPLHELNLKRIILSSIPVTTPNNLIYKLFPWSESVRIHKNEFEITVTCKFKTEKAALDAFKKGDNLILNGSKITVIYDKSKIKGASNSHLNKESITQSLSVIKSFCVQRINDNNELTLYVSFPTPLSSKEIIEKMIPMASFVRVNARQMRESKITYAHLTFNSPELAKDHLLNIIPKCMKGIKVNTITKTESIDYELNLLRLVIKNIPADADTGVLEDFLKQNSFAFVNLERNRGQGTRKNGSYNTWAFLTYAKEHLALRDFHKGQNVFFENRRLFFMFDDLKETERKKEKIQKKKEKRKLKKEKKGSICEVEERENYNFNKKMRYDFE